MALITRLTSRRPGQSRRKIARDVLLVSLGVWPIEFVSSAPATLINLAGVSIQTGRLIATWLLIGAAGMTTIAAFLGAHRSRRRNSANAGRDYFAPACVAVYLVVCIVLWGAALPDYLAAHHGVTASGAPIGSFPYAVVTAVLAVALTIGAYLPAPWP
ncbi:hypothetical protein [Nocardia sp. BMG111209]|uniref:hypothetical protein n=1 Tax=Nocardia sp. BMG111209 TaxID=1160137 RepID=UPI000361C92C|nr:hypothetical protein [Nocardia sp. BMG111209]